MPICLRAQRQHAVVLGAGTGGEAVDDFLLQHDDRPCEGMRATEQVFQNCAARRIWQIAEKFERAMFEQHPAIELRAIRVMDLHTRLIAVAFA